MCIRLFVILSFLGSVSYGQEIKQTDLDKCSNFFRSTCESTVSLTITKVFENGLAKEISLFPSASLYRKRHAVIRLPVREAATQVLEFKLLGDKSWLRATTLKTPPNPDINLEPGSSLTGGFDWTESKIGLIPFVYPLFGLHFGDGFFIDFIEDSCWDKSRFEIEQKMLTRCFGNGAKVQFHFDENREFAGYTVLYPGHDNTEDGVKSFFFQLEKEETGFAWTYKTKFRYLKNGQEKTTEYRAEITPDDSEQDDLHFFESNISERHPVRIEEDEWSKYEFSKGKIVKILDEQAILRVKEIYLNKYPTRKITIAKTFQLDAFGSEVTCELANYLRGRASLPHCGEYSLCAAAANEGIWIPQDRLFASPEIVASKGASAEDLIKLAGDNGVEASMVERLSIGGLKSLGCSAVLHFKNSNEIEGIDHWVAFLGFDEEGNALIFDAPRKVEKVRPATLLTYWDGTAVLVGEQPVGVPSKLLSKFVPAMLWVAFALASVATMSRLVPKRTTASQLFSLSLAAVAIATSWAIVSPLSFYNNKESVKFCHVKSPRRANIISVDLESILSDPLLASGRVAFVDCRHPDAYEKTHIENAINFPIDASLGESQNAVDQLKGNDKIICYCQSRSCKWAEIVAQRLLEFGFEDVAVLYGGINELPEERKRYVADSNKS